MPIEDHPLAGKLPLPVWVHWPGLTSTERCGQEKCDCAVWFRITNESVNMLIKMGCRFQGLPCVCARFGSLIE